jgi:hypothetical protein
MSTFTDNNGPCGDGFNYIFFRKTIDELRRELTELTAKLPFDAFTTVDTGDTAGTVRAKIDAVKAEIPPLIARLDALDREVKTSKLTVKDSETGHELLDVSEGVFRIYQDLKAANIDVKNIKAGPSLIFDEYHTVSHMIGTGSIESGSFQDFYVLAELVRVRPEPAKTATITYPCTLYVYNNADPKVSAVIYATETGLAVLHSGRDFPASKDPGAPPRVKYAVVRTGSSDNEYHYYVCMIMYQQGITQVKLACTALKVAMINAIPVTKDVTGIGTLVPGDTLETSRSSDFLVSHLSITDLVVGDMHATKLTVDTTSDLKGTVTIGTQDAKTELKVNGTETIAGNLNVTGKTTTKELDIDTLTTRILTATEHINTPQVRSVDSAVPMIAADSETVTVGAANRILDLVSNIRPTVKAAGEEQEIAYRSDLASSIVYKGPYLIYSRGVPEYFGKIQINDDSTPAYYTLKTGDKCLALIDGTPTPPRPDGVTEAQIARVYEYVVVPQPPPPEPAPQKDYWKPAEHDIPHPVHDQTYQWHITYLKQGNDVYFHQSEVLWNPDNDPGEIISYVNLPLEDYYTKEQIEKLVTMFYDLSTRQADWFATNKVSADDWRKNGIDNPAYIRNKPLTGFSVLDGGAFVDPDVVLDYPQFVMDGGDFNTLGVSRGTYETYDDLPQPPAVDTTGWVVNDYAYVRQDRNYTFSSTRYKIKAIATTEPHIIEWKIDQIVNDIGNLRKDVVYKLWAGAKADLPPYNTRTKYALKWCVDTRELFVDMYGVKEQDESFVNGNRRLTIPEITTLYDASIARGTESDVDRILSVIQTFNVSRATGNYTINWKLLSADKRISFNPISPPANDTWTIPVNVYTADILAMITPYTLATQEATWADTPKTLTLAWKTMIYTDLHTWSNKTESLTFLPGDGITLVYDGIDAAAKKLTVQLNEATIAALDTTPVLQVVTASVDGTAGFSFGVAGNYLRNQTTPFSKSLTLKVGDGLVITPDLPVTDKPAGTINMSSDLATALNQNVVLSCVYASETTGAKITTVENKLYKRDPATDVTKSLIFKTDNTLKLLNTGSTATDKIVTIGLADNILAQEYITEVTPDYDSAVDKGIILKAYKRPFGIPVATMKSLTLTPGANMTFVKTADSDEDNLRIQLNATMAAPTFAPVTLTTDPAAVTGTFTAGRSGGIVNGVFTIENIATGTTTPIEGQFQETLAESLRPLTPLTFSYGDSAITNASIQSLTIETDGHVSFSLGPPGSVLTVPLMYFGK